MFRRLSLLALVLVAALTVSVSVAVAGVGNSPAKELCKKGGWMGLVRADQTPFADQGECVTYVTQGGIPAPPTTGQYADARAACTAITGTFGVPGVDVADFGSPPAGSVLLWTCNAWPTTTPGTAISGAEWGQGYCDADGGAFGYQMHITSNQPTSGNTGIACYRLAS